VSLNYTPLRHAMLKAGSAGHVQLVKGKWTYRTHPSTASQMTRALKWLLNKRYAEVGRASGSVKLSIAGTILLTSWDSRYGEPTP
jgi:hypothetical protein